MISPSASPNHTRWLALPLALGLAAAGLLLGAVRSARADMAPLPAQEGNSLGPASATNIQMISETVLIQLTEITKTFGDTSYPVPGAKVVADFAMRNPGTSPQALQVGFPMQVPQQAAQSGDYVKITNLVASVGGVAIETNAATIGTEIWSAWQMTFAPGNTLVRVTYDLPVTTDACNAELGYVLHTGAAWAGSIGQADLIVRYPYAAEATFVSPHGIYLANSTPGYRVEGNDLHWHYDNLEPTPANDLAVTFVAPECWRLVAAARTALNQHATATNYWNLAVAYAAIVFPHHGFYSPLIAQIAEAQYQKALALDPKNPQINAGYAEFLQIQVGALLPANRQPDANQQCVRALLLAPHDDQLLYTCVPVLNAMIGDPNVSSAAQATAAAVLTVAPLPTFPPSATPFSPPATPSAVASPSPLPAASSTLQVTETPPPAPSSTASPSAAPPPATHTPIAVAQVTAVVSPTPQAQPANSFPGALILVGVVILIGLVVLAVVVVGVYYWRRKPASHSNP